MKTGAFALLDCLGFKGIWQRVSADLVIGKLDAIEEWLGAGEWAKKLAFSKDHPDLLTGKVILLSDTIAVSITRKEENMLPGLIPIALMVKLIEEINKRFLVDEPHLLLRGCVTYGEHLATDRFIIGPAVDRAAEYEKLPNGSFVWLEPAAAREYKEYLRFMEAMSIPVYPKRSLARAKEIILDESVEVVERLANVTLFMGGLPNPIIDDYKMPIKGGEKLVCSIVNPLNNADDEEELESLYKIYERQFVSDRIDVLVKKANTLEFLEHCKDITKDHLRRREDIFNIIAKSDETVKSTKSGITQKGKKAKRSNEKYS